MAISVNNRLANALIELHAIAKIHKHRGLHEGHHFILMGMEVHNTPKHVMYRFIKELFIIFTVDDQKFIYLCLLAFSFSSNVLIFFFNMLLLLP